MSEKELLNKPQMDINSENIRKKDLISIIIPARNEEGNIDRLERELLAVIDPLPYDFEFIVIDNDSTDQTGKKVKNICDRDPRWRYIRFSRNFTVEMSLTAGYMEARGDAIVVLYSDLQDPPEVISRFIEKWKEGYDIVYGVRTVETVEKVLSDSRKMSRFGILQVSTEIRGAYAAVQSL